MAPSSPSWTPRPEPGRTLVSPDVATCTDCLAEFADPADRRYRHPFITCTNCGPRFTIITGLPYDRPATTMAGFPLCPDCAREYADPGRPPVPRPADRLPGLRPAADSSCQPGVETAYDEDALAAAHQLLVDGRDPRGQRARRLPSGLRRRRIRPRWTTLRKRKDRGDKPFAVMAADLDTARRIAVVDAGRGALLTGIRRPIVLLRRTAGARPSRESVAPGNPDLGVMLPYTPLHRLLFDQPGPCVLVMTSGNLSGEPIVTYDEEALDPAGRVWPMPGSGTTARSTCPATTRWYGSSTEPSCRYAGRVGTRRSRSTCRVPVRPALAVGGDLKNTFCLGDGRYAWLSAHVGDMDDLATLQAFERAEQHLEQLTGVRPEVLVTDKHPSYRSRQWAELHADGRPVVGVQHHHAHLASVMAEHGYDGEPVIGFAFDGTGYGDDGAVWGGEVLLAGYDGFERYAHLQVRAAARRRCGRAEPLPDGVVASARRGSAVGSAAAVRTGVCRRSWTCSRPSWSANIACAPTSSMGRLFDAVSSLAGVCHRAGYEAQAAIELEGLARRSTGRQATSSRSGRG